MTKEETLEAMENIRNYHEQGMFEIGNLVKGREVEEPVPVFKHQCEFGIWLYAKNNHVMEILGDQFFHNLESIHTEWHMSYHKIHQIFYKEKKKGFFASLLASHKVDAMELDKAKLYYTELEQVTKVLLASLASSQRRVHAMSENRFH